MSEGANNREERSKVEKVFNRPEAILDHTARFRDRQTSFFAEAVSKQVGEAVPLSHALETMKSSILISFEYASCQLGHQQELHVGFAHASLHGSSE